jgi:cysteine desulfuration protein SufE
MGQHGECPDREIDSGLGARGSGLRALGSGLWARQNMLQKLQDLLETFDMFPDPADRTGLLLSYADQFREVPPEVATRPFPESNHVPQCESDAYIWAVRRPDGTLQLHFAVENPSGVSARALATILDRTLSGLRPEEIVTIDCGIVERIFRRNISMGKGIGLMAMVDAVRTLARRALVQGVQEVHEGSKGFK